MKRFVLVPSAVAMVAVTLGASAATASAATPTGLGNPASAVTVNEDGSSLLAPYLSNITPQITSAYPNVTLASAAGGSGKGQTDALGGVVQLGGSDAYLAPAQFTTGVQNIPITIASQSIDYNLKGVKGLKLSGNVIAEIYQGKITKWNDPAIKKLNKGAKLPASTIVPIVRSDSSGDTFNFSSFLSATNAAWKSSPGFNTSITFPKVSGELTASGNPAMVQLLSQTPGGIAYVGSSAEPAALATKLGEAALQNKSGKFVLPSKKTVTSSVNAAASSIPANFAFPGLSTLIDAKGKKSYPIVNLEYLIVKSPYTSADTSMAVRDVLAFAINPKQGSSVPNLQPQGFVPLPKALAAKVSAAISSIKP